MTDAQPAYRVRRSGRARRARLTLDEQGRATVVLPLRVPQRVADQLLATHAGWLERQRERMRLEQAALDARPALGAGRQLLLDGLPHTLVLDPLGGLGLRSTVAVGSESHGGRLIVRLAAADPRPPADVLEAWLRRRARAVIERRVELRAAQMRVRPTSLAIRDQHSRWASASARGGLSFSWRLVLCPPWVLDYVVVHELAHLRVSGHGRAFWALVDEHLPAGAARDARRWLRTNRLGLRRALD